MNDDAIRDLLAKVTHGYMGLLAGHVAAPFGHVEALGGDAESVRTWVEAHGGWVENPAAAMRRGLRPGRVVEPASPNRTQFVIPASALEPEP